LIAGVSAAEAASTKSSNGRITVSSCFRISPLPKLADFAACRSWNLIS
jgi:hypothetical protein